MLNELRPLYETEMAYFRSLSQEFAERFPKIASRLGMDAGEIRDPHAERFIQSSALLAARIQHKLDDDFPELIEGLLQILYPHVLRPIPSMALVRMALQKKQSAAADGTTVPRGTMLECGGPDGTVLQYRTSREATLLPVTIDQVRFENQPLEGPCPPDAVSRLCVKLSPLSGAMPLAELSAANLRFGIVLPQLPAAGRLLELLLESCLDVRWNDNHRTARSVGALPRGLPMSDADALIPFEARSFSGYRLLTELFSFPESLLFFDLPQPFEPLRDTAGADFADPPELQFYFDREDRELSRLIDTTSVQLGLCPIVNLFRQTAPNLPVDQTQAEVRIVPDTRRQSSTEVYSVDRVVGLREDGTRIPTQPFFRTAGRNDDTAASGTAAPFQTDGLFWHTAKRSHAELRPEETPSYGDQSADWDETFLTLVDFSGSPQIAEVSDLSVQTTCFNRDLPNAIARSGRLPQFRSTESSSIDIATVTRPTPTRRWSGRSESRWRWLSHVSLGALPLSQGTASPDTLKALLRLYGPLSLETTKAPIDGIRDFRCRSDMAYLPGIPGGFCRGVEATLDLDEDAFIGHSPYLLARVLREVLSRYVSINSFVRLRASTAEMRRHGREWTWPPKAGDRELL